MQPTDLAIALRRRTPWEACDLGLSMLQRWWRPVYAPHLAVGGVLAAAALVLGWLAGHVWIAFALVWWLKPLYDRVVLHVLSRAVFGELQQAPEVLGRVREWLGTGLFMGLTFGRFDLARSFSLPVRQLEGLRGFEGRRRRELLGRRARSHAVWLMLVCMHLEFVVFLSLGSLLDLFIPAKASEGLSLRELFFPDGTGDSAWTLREAGLYAASVLLFEPLYVAAGFGLYLNRRIQLEGWDLEVALRGITEKRTARAAAAAALVLVIGMAAAGLPQRAVAEEKPKGAAAEMAEVLKAPEFGRWEDEMQWQRRSPGAERDNKDPTWLRAFGRMFAKVFQVLAWIGAGVAIVWLVWSLVRSLPAVVLTPRETYRPPPELFGMALAPESLPPDIAAAAAALAREGKLREALSLLYRGVLSELVHRRNVELLASHTEGEALRLAQAALGAPASGYLVALVGAWAACAYARRTPQAAEVERLANEYRTALA